MAISSSAASDRDTPTNTNESRAGDAFAVADGGRDEHSLSRPVPGLLHGGREEEDRTDRRHAIPRANTNHGARRYGFEETRISFIIFHTTRTEITNSVAITTITPNTTIAATTAAAIATTATTSTPASTTLNKLSV